MRFAKAIRNLLGNYWPQSTSCSGIILLFPEDRKPELLTRRVAGYLRAGAFLSLAVCGKPQELRQMNSTETQDKIFSTAL
jgi:hypothetical protein